MPSDCTVERIYPVMSMNSPVVVLDPINTHMSIDYGSHILTRSGLLINKNTRKLENNPADRERYVRTGRYPSLVDSNSTATSSLGSSYNSPSGSSTSTRSTISADSAVAATGTILGAASALNPLFAIPAATVGIGYGVYKLGESLNIW